MPVSSPESNEARPLRLLPIAAALASSFSCKFFSSIVCAASASICALDGPLAPFPLCASSILNPSIFGTFYRVTFGILS